MRKILGLVLLLCALMVHAEPTAVQQLENFIAKAKNIQANFVQNSLSESGSVMQRSEGTFYLQQPGKFRWNYQKPYQQEIVSKEGKVWFYDADLEQVIIKKIDESIGDTPALLLSGSIDLNTKYTLVGQAKRGDLLWLKLIPKSSDSSFKYIRVGLKNDVLYGMELSDNFGQLTQIIFSNVKTPATLDASLFEFVAPPGTDVFEG